MEKSDFRVIIASGRDFDDYVKLVKMCKQGNGVWSEDIFYLLRNDGRISGISGIWDVAVPYNSWTAHIIGTHLPPPPFFQYWF